MRQELVLRARSGDHEAFAALATEAFERLRRTARLILRDDEQAADAVQEALTAAWLHVRAVRDPDRFDAWLHRLTVHACYREARRARRRGIVEVHVAALDLPASTDEVGAMVRRDQIERGFSRLTAEQRAVLVVHHYLDLSDAEAASVLDIPIGTFKSRLSRATSALRASLQADDRAPALTKESTA